VGNDPLSIVVADLNGDSKLDLAVANANDHYVSILQGKGDGTFADAINYGASRGPTAIALADFNGDGKPDLAMTSFWFSKISILLNNTPTPVSLTGVASRKTHGGAGTFDIDLPLDGTGVECRSGGAGGYYTLVFSFANTLTSVGGASLASGTGTISSSAVGSDPHEYIVNLTGVTNAQRLTVVLNNVQDASGNISNTLQGALGVLVGDTTGNGAVNSSDIAQTQSQSGQAVTASNFREDVTANGAINSSDVALVQSKSGTALP
jgi:hypothetical protein